MHAGDIGNAIFVALPSLKVVQTKCFPGIADANKSIKA
jgi:hypothetical protein